MRRKIVAGNWKMNLSAEEAKTLMAGLNDFLSTNQLPNNTEVVVAPTYIYLHSIIENTSKIKVAAQNCSEDESGAFTGEVSVKQLQSIGCKCVILGHSERRAYNNESAILLKSKTDTALKNGLEVIFCCGESLEQRQEGKHFETIKHQIKDSLFHLTAEEFKNIVIAYEPIWAIGTGETASPAQAQEIHAFIRETLANHFNAETAENTSILYGGSVKPANAKELFSQKDIDGGLVGGASLKAIDFTEIIKAV